MTQMRLYPRVASLTPADAIFIIDVGTDGSPNTKSIPGDKVLESLIGERINIGGTDTNSTDPVVNVNRAVDGTGTNGHCFSDSSAVNRAGTVAYNSFDSRIIVSGTDNYGHFAGFQCAPDIGTSGTTADVYGYYDKPTITTGTVTRRYAFYAANYVSATGGAIQTNYGLYVEDLGGASATYSIYAVGNDRVKLGDCEIVPAQAASGDLAAGVSIRPTDTNMSLMASASATAGRKLQLVAYGDSAFREALSVTSTGAGVRPALTLCRGGGQILAALPATASDPTTNGDMTVELTNNTTLTFKVKGTDGTVRSGTLTLA